MRKSNGEAFDIYADVTGRIVEALEAGVVPWRRPWVAGADSMHNPVTGTIYRGVNPLLLELRSMTAGYSDPRWVTFKQARTLGGGPRKGEKGTRVVFWKMLRGLDRATGEARSIPLLKHYVVFNVAQCDGLELEPLATGPGFDPFEAAEAILEHMPKRPPISYGGGQAFYVPAQDRVQLPNRESFTGRDGFYSTAFHELAHSTGHDSRLNRPEVSGKGGAFGSEPYAREELVAELTAAMLCGVCGVDPSGGRIEQSAAYIGGWLRALKDDRKLLVQAAGKAQRAADFILDRKAPGTVGEGEHERPAPTEPAPLPDIAPIIAAARESAGLTLF